MPVFNDEQITRIAKDAARSKSGLDFMTSLAKDESISDDELMKIGKSYKDETLVFNTARQYGLEDLPSRGYFGDIYHNISKGIDRTQEAAVTTFEGDVPLDDDKTVVGRIVKKQRADAMAIPPSREEILNKGIHKDVAEGMQSVPLSLATGGTGFVAGTLASGGNPLVGAAAAAGTSFALMYKPAAQDFKRQVRDAIKEKYDITEDQWKTVLTEIDEAATKSGLAEAGGEALSSGLEYLLFGIPLASLGKPLAKIIGEPIAKKIISSTLINIGTKTVGTMAAELTGEGITQEAQTGQLAKTPYTKDLVPEYDENEPYPVRLAKATKEVAGPTMVASLFQAGGLGAVKGVIGGQKIANMSEDDLNKRIGNLEDLASKGGKLSQIQTTALNSYKEEMVKRKTPTITKESALEKIKEAYSNGTDIVGLEESDTAKKLGITKEDISKIAVSKKEAVQASVTREAPTRTIETETETLAPETPLETPPQPSLPVGTQSPGQTIMAAALDPGDKIKIKGEEFEAKGMQDGKMVLEDGEIIRVAPDADLTIDSIEKAPAPEKQTLDVRKQFEDAAVAAGGKLDGEYEGMGAWSVTDGVTKSSFMVKSPDEIPARFAEARAKAEAAKPKVEEPALTNASQEAAPLKPGMAWVDNQQRPIYEVVKPKGRRNAGKVIVVLNNAGKRAKINETDIIRMPEVKEPDILQGEVKPEGKAEAVTGSMDLATYKAGDRINGSYLGKKFTGTVRSDRLNQADRSKVELTVELDSPINVYGEERKSLNINRDNFVFEIPDRVTPTATSTGKAASPDARTRDFSEKTGEDKGETKAEEGKAVIEPTKTEEPKFTRAKSSGMPITEVQKLANNLTAGMQNVAPIEVFQNIKDLNMPVDALDKMNKANVIDEDGNSDVAGMLWKGKIYLFADNISSDMDVARTVVKHEMFHDGFAKLMEKMAGRNKLFTGYNTDLKALLNEIWTARETEVRQHAKERQDQLKIDDKDAFVRDSARRRASEEWLANQAPTSETKWYDRLIAIFQNFMKAMGFKGFSDAQARVLISDAYGMLKGKSANIEQFSQAPKFTLKEAVNNILNNPAFKEWFGDSKVVDEKGIPLVVYHGTNEPLTEFNETTVGENNPQSLGFHFSNMKSEAKTYAEQAKENFGGKKNIVQAYLKIEKPLFLKAADDSFAFNVLDENEEEIRKVVGSGKYDGVIMQDNNGYINHVAFSPTQIKSIYNRGTFSPTDPNIMFTFGESEGMPMFTRAAEELLKPENADRLMNILTYGSKQIDQDQAFNDTAINYHTKDPKDLYKGIRWFQTMFDLARNYPELRAILDVQTKRVASSHALTVADKEILQPFYALKDKKRVNDALLEGDKKNKEYYDMELKSIFHLTAEEIAGYRAVRKALNNKLDTFIHSMLKNAVSSTTKITPTMIKIVKTSSEPAQFHEQMVEKQGLSEHEFERISWMWKWAKEHEGYVPHKWDSKWLVKVVIGKANEYLLPIPTVKGQMLPTRGMRRAAAEEQATLVLRNKFGWSNSEINKMVKEGRIIVRRSSELPVDLFEGARLDVIQSIVNDARDKMFDEYAKHFDDDTVKKMDNVKDAINTYLKELYLAKGWGRHLMGRRGVKGYRTDVENVLAEYLAGANSFIAKGEAAKDFAQAMGEISVKDTPVMWQHAKEYISDMLGDANEATVFKKIVGTYFLAGDASAAVLNMTQNWTHAVPMLKDIEPKDKRTAEADIAKGMKDVFNEYQRAKRAKRLLFSKANIIFSQEEVDAYRKAYAEGHLDPAFMGETTGIQSNKIWQDTSQKIFTGLFKMFTGAEGWNRTSTFFAAYRRAKRAGMSNDGAYLKAVEIINTAHFVYGKGNRPLIVRNTGAIGNIAFTFMTYPLNNLVFLKHRIQDLLEAHTAGDKKATRKYMKILGANLGYLFAIGGLYGLPFAYLGQTVYNLFADDDDDWEVLMRKHMPKEVGRTIARGLPASIIGNDFSWRVQGTDVLGLPIGFEIIKMGGKRIEKAQRFYEQDRLLDMLFVLTPDIMRSPYQAVMGAIEGGEASGRAPIKYTAGEAITRGLGFTPTREAEAYKVGEVILTKKTLRTERLGNFAERYITALDNSVKMESLRKDIFEYNQKQKGVEGLPIMMSDIIKSAKMRIKDRRKGYLDRAPKYLHKYQDSIENSMGIERSAL